MDRRTHDTANACIVIYWGDNTVDNGLFRERSTYSFNPQFDRGENESIFNGLEPVLGLGFRRNRPLGLN